MKNFWFCLFSFLLLSFHCVSSERESLLKELDDKVEKRRFYMDIKEKRIDSLRSLLVPDLTFEKKYGINNEIFEEYSTYRFDSAMRYVTENREIAEKLNVNPYKDEVNIHLSMLLSTTGMYRESIENLERIDRKSLDPSLLLSYYSTYEWTYYAAGEYTNDSLYAPNYHALEGYYRDSVYQTLPPETERYIYYKGKILHHEGKYKEALDIFLELFPSMRVDTRLYAIVTYDIATIYKELGNMEEHEKFLILAAISDQVCPLKENLAMQELALYLYMNRPDDLDRAYRYIQCSLEDARFYNNRLRIVQISEKLPIIVKGYQIKSEQEKRRITFALIIISLLSIITIISLIYIYKQMKVVQRSRQDLRALNEELNSLNVRLQDANHIKEEYLGLFMDLCSSYIEKLDRYRETIKRKVMSSQIDDLYKMVNSKKIIDQELAEFFHNFDSAFLKLYPTFVEEFNKLLEVDKQIVLKKGELLDTELRIFALIRLGIDDSSQIANFLRYSPQTIYNYRTKVKNKATVDRNDFEKEVKKIGVVR